MQGVGTGRRASPASVLRDDVYMLVSLLRLLRLLPLRDVALDHTPGVTICSQSPITMYCFHGVTASGHFSKRHTHLHHHRLASS